MRPILLLAPFIFLAGCVGAPQPPAAIAQPADPARIETDVRFLADDLLEGREAGTRGYDLAARYVAARFAGLGLAPGGDDGGWLQRVPLLRGERLREGARLALERDGEVVEFAFEADFLPGVNWFEPEVALSAPLVFVGQGVHAPEFDHDDFAGLDLTGKVAVVLGGAPARFGNAPRAHHASGRTKAEALVARGAVGMLSIGDPEREAKYPWARGAANWSRPGMRLRGDDGRAVDAFPELRATASMGVAAARRLFDGAALDADAVYARQARGEAGGFDLPGTLHFAARSRLAPLDSDNVVGRVTGSDPALAAEAVVYTAHLDHVGIGAEIDGDAIYNGALDNALGIGVMLEAARLAVQRPTRRSRWFVALTAEEKGLLGAEHFAATPLPDGGRIVANLNLDMPVLLTEVRDAIAIGIEHSDLRAPAEAEAEALGIALTPDPMPEEVVFVRSDQYAFIRRGIPALYLDGGIVASDPAIDGKALLDGFLRGQYHQPGDEADLPIHYPSAARLAELAAGIGRRVGDADAAPRWNPGDFFGTRFGRAAGGGD